MDKKSILFNIYILFLCLCTLFVTSFHFVDKEVLPKWYALYFLALSGCLLFCFTAKSIKFKIDKITICILFLFGYLLIGSSFRLAYGMSAVFQCLAFLLLFLFFKFNPNQHQLVVNLSIVAACTLQAIYGILQFTGIINSNSSFAVDGSFDNPAGFAACLSSGFAFCFTLWKKKRYLNYISIATISIIGIAIILSGSRAGGVSILVILFIYTYPKLTSTFTKRDKLWLKGVLVFASLLLAISLLFYKKDSATGRLLIWKTTLDMASEKPILGWGSNSFRSQYMLHQAAYFRENNNSKYMQLADNVVHPFNEYLLLMAEYGVMGLILFFLLICTIYKTRNKKDIIYLLAILSVLIFACFSYPLRYPFVWLVLAYSFANISNNSRKIYYQWEGRFNSILKVGGILILFSCYYFIIKDIKFEYKWSESANLSLLGKTKSMIPVYEELYTQWNGNPLFLYNYGAELNYINQYDKSTLILHECERYYNDYDLQMILADNYFNQKDYINAEFYYKKASQMCPNRFLPLKKMMDIFRLTGNNENAKNMARMIIDKKIKVQSPTVFKCRLEAQKILEK